MEEAAVGHRLVISSSASVSVLGEAGDEPGLLAAEVAFGQPSREQVEQAPRLRWLQLSSAGYARFDHSGFRAHARERGLIVSNASSVFDDPCAQHVLAFMLAHVRRLPAAFEEQRTTRSWEGLRHRADARILREQTVLLLGFGSIARRMTELLAPFGVKVQALRRHPTGDENVEIIGEEQLPTALASAAHVVNILPESAATSGFINAERLAQMQPGAVFYNIGRGTTVEQPALIEALKSGHLTAAYLDVTDPEPLPPDHPLWRAPRCFITPHIGGGHQEEHLDLARHFAANFARFQAGEPLRDRVI